MRASAFLAAFLAGAAAMIDETAWFRLLAPLAGSESAAAALLLAAFVGGGALGSGLAPRLGRAIGEGRALALMQASLAVYAGLSWLAPPLLEPAPRPLGALFVALPAVATGMTVPLLARAGAAELYGLNCAGAVLGVLACGFALIEALGVPGALAVAASAHAAAALLAVRSGGPAAGTEQVRAPERLVLGEALLYGSVSFAVVGLQPVWTRALAARFLEVSAYSFSCVVAAAIAGLAAGSLLGRRSGRGAALAAAAGLPLATAAAWRFLPEVAAAVSAWLPQAEPSASWSWAQSVGAEAALAFAVLAIPGLLGGLAFAALGRDRGAADVARLLWIGGAAGAAGALAIGLWAVPALGVRGALAACSAPAALCLAALAWRGNRERWAAAAAVAGVVLMARAQPWPGQRPAEALAHRVLFQEEAAGATVEVWESFMAGRSAWDRVLVVDGHPVAGTEPLIQADQKLLAHIPLLLHPAPRKALTVGLGTGGTSHSMRLHGVEVVCYEILAAVRRAAELFGTVHGRLFSDPGFRLQLGDARRLLRESDERFDVIVSDVTDIHFLGNASLLTREYFALAKSRLAAGGLFAVWLPRDPGPEVLRSVFATFLHEFPDAALFYPYQLDSHFTILVGFTGSKTAWSDFRARALKPEIRKDLATVGSSAPERLALYAALDSADLRRLASDAPIHSDLRPVLDFQAPRWAHAHSDLLIKELARMPSREAAALRFQGGEALALSFKAARAEAIAAYAAMGRGDLGEALKRAKAAKRARPEDRELAATLADVETMARLKRADALVAAGRPAQAEAELLAVLAGQPDHVAALNNLSELALRNGEVDRSAGLLVAAGAALPEASWIPGRLESILGRGALRR